jgi:zinc transport system ATP-binding protein
VTAGPAAGTAPHLLEVRRASFGYEDTRIVDRVSLTVDDGEVVAILGPNGSGKSTLVRGALGLVPRLGGDVLFRGSPLRTTTAGKQVGYVPQRHTLQSAVRSTVKEIVATGRLAHRPWWRPSSAEDRRLVAAALETVGLADRADHEVATLSGGQQRRVLIARALAGEPELLIMDEPTAGVDHANQDVLSRVLADLAAQGRAMLVVTHELDALEGIVTRIVCLDGGRIDFEGPPAAYAAHLQDGGSGHPPGADHHHDEAPKSVGVGVRVRAPLDGTDGQGWR